MTPLGPRLRRMLPLALAALLIGATVFAPRWPWPRQRFDHLVVIDITQSMNVPDAGGAEPGAPPAAQRVARLAFAKQALHAALDRLPCGSRLGWAVFTEYRSFLLTTPVEVCANRAELRQTLEAIDNRMAWAGGSEVAKGLHSALALARALPDKPSVVFVTDGHEAPPLSPRHRPHFDDEPGAVPGVLIGVGGLAPAPIPKLDPAGRPLGVWGIDEVLQADPFSSGRGASVQGEAMAEAPTDKGGEGSEAPGLGATPGSEHLSALREPYLQLLAQENGLAYRRAARVEDVAAAMQAPELARRIVIDGDARVALAVVAGGLLLLPHAWAGWAAWRAARRAGGASPAWAQEGAGEASPASRGRMF